MVNGTKEAQGITAITVSGFKSLRDESRIEVRPLTILAGANSSGKSSIMQPLLLMKQTLEAPYDPGPLLLNGDHVKFTRAEQFLVGSISADKFQDLKIILHVEGNISLTEIFRKMPQMPQIEVTEMVYSKAHGSVHFRPEMSHHEIRQEFITALELIKPEREGFGVALSGLTQLDVLRWRVIRNRCFLEFEMPGEIYGAGVKGPPLAPGAQFVNSMLRFIHVPGLRGTRERLYPLTPVIGPAFAGVFDHYVGSVIRHWSLLGPDSPLTYLTKILGPTLELTNGIGTQQHDDTSIEILVGRGYKGVSTPMVNIIDVGFGVSQVLPVIVALLVAEPGQLVYIEQPELHLHPRAQVALAQVLADAANRGVRVVAETHSSLLLLGLQTLIAEGNLSSENVMLHWFTRNDEGVTTIRSEEPDENGAYGDWPEDFDDVQLNAQKRYLDVVAEREMGMVNGNRETSGD